MSNLKEISEVLKGGNYIVLYPHENMDADAFGSCVALAKALRQEGKEAYIFYTEEIPDNLVFMNNGYVITQEEEALKADIAMLIDCGDPSRIGNRKEVFLKAPTTICLDHHSTSEPACAYNFICPEEAATGQIIYDLLQEMGTKADREIGEAIFAAITTDTGKFQYSNTQKKSHEITAKLYDWGIRPNEVSREIYESNRFERLLIESLAMNMLRMTQGGKIAVTHVTREDLDRIGAQDSETENIVGKLRSIKGVEVGAFLREKKDGKISVSLRSKQHVDVAKIGEKLGGGGHLRAAGATLSDISMEDALELVRKTIEEAFDGQGE